MFKIPNTASKDYRLERWIIRKWLDAEHDLAGKQNKNTSLFVLLPAYKQYYPSINSLLFKRRPLVDKYGNTQEATNYKITKTKITGIKKRTSSNQISQADSRCSESIEPNESTRIFQSKKVREKFASHHPTLLVTNTSTSQ